MIDIDAILSAQITNALRAQRRRARASGGGAPPAVDAWPPEPFAVTRDFGGVGSSTLDGVSAQIDPFAQYQTLTTGGTLYDATQTKPASGGVLVDNEGIGGQNSTQILARVNGTTGIPTQDFTTRMLAMDLGIQLGGNWPAGATPEDGVLVNMAAILTKISHLNYAFFHKHYDAIAPSGSLDHVRLNRFQRLTSAAYPGRAENISLMWNKYPPVDGADTAAQVNDVIPPSKQIDTAHANSAGNLIMAEKCWLPWQWAMRFGHGWVPHQEHYFEVGANLNVSGQNIGTIPHHPQTTIAGATFETGDSRFSAAVEGSAVVLRRADTTPITAGYVDIPLVHTQGGVQRTVHQRCRFIRANPSDERAHINSQWMTREAPVANAGNGGKKFSAAMLLRVVSGDGTSRRIAYTGNGVGLTIEIKTTNRIGFVIRDTANVANPVNLDGGTGANLILAASGWMAFFLCCDTTTGVQVTKVAVDSLAAVTNTPTADALLNIFPNVANITNRLFTTNATSSGLCDIECGGLWMASDYVDFGNTANRDLFRNPATMRSVLSGAGTIAGVSPFLWMQGPAGNWSSGMNLAAPADFWDCTTRAQITTV